jgi:hypothetical protein
MFNGMAYINKSRHGISSYRYSSGLNTLLWEYFLFTFSVLVGLKSNHRTRQTQKQ